MKKGSAAPKNIDEYLATVPEPARGTLKKIRAAIQSVVPREATETISYGMHHSIPHGQASAGRSCEKAGEGAHCPDWKKETALIG